MRNVRKERGEEEVVVVMVRKMLCEKKINEKNKQEKTNTKKTNKKKQMDML